MTGTVAWVALATGAAYGLGHHLLTHTLRLMFEAWTEVRRGPTDRESV